MSEIEIAVLDPDSWARARAVRLAALTSDPDAYGARAEGEAKLNESQWRNRVESDLWVVASVSGLDVAVMTVAPTVPALVEPSCPVDPLTCAWAYGCWVAPEMRGRRIPAAFVEFLEHMAPMYYVRKINSTWAAAQRNVQHHHVRIESVEVCPSLGCVWCRTHLVSTGLQSRC